MDTEGVACECRRRGGRLGAGRARTGTSFPPNRVELVKMAMTIYVLVVIRTDNPGKEGESDLIRGEELIGGMHS